MERATDNLALTKLVSSSSLISSGHPSVYQLITQRGRLGALTKVTVGQKGPHQKNRTILLVGETGAGKSSVVDVIFNHAVGVRAEDDVWFQLVDEEEGQTSDVIIYEIFGLEGAMLPSSLTIIDTPGYGSTRGVQQDQVTVERIHQLFEAGEGVRELHAVGLVMKATDNRLSDRLMYVFDTVMALFGNDMEKNIAALITHSNGRRPKNALEALQAANVRCAKDPKNQPLYFLFNNWQKTEQTNEAEYVKGADLISEGGIRGFAAFVEHNSPQRVKLTTEVMNERVRLTACIHNLLERIGLTEQKQREIQQIRGGLEAHEAQMDSPVTFDQPYVDKEQIRGAKKGLIFFNGAVVCMRCQENCHYPGCTRTWFPELCEVMRMARCTVCSSRCPASVHEKTTWIYVHKTRKVTKTVREVRHDRENKSEFHDQTRLLGNLEKEMEQLSKDKWRLVDEAYQHVVRLEQIALKANSVSINVHLDFLIEKMQEKGDTMKVQKLKELKRRVDEGTKAAQKYKRV